MRSFSAKELGAKQDRAKARVAGLPVVNLVRAYIHTFIHTESRAFRQSDGRREREHDKPRKRKATGV